ncbi:MAG: hypothetical protein Q7W45_04290 [Bacteroidota bacterium]|nr:hypothetical protein [Bacteroidota bacterium]MDP3144667.1 hypothetical protein [Bacteroidota bacterium]
MIKNEILFEEKQYMGHNRLSIVIRSLITLFCFVAYYWSENPKPVQLSFVKIGSYPIENTNESGLIFFIIGVCILIFSTVLTYILHIQTKVYNGFLILDGFWTARKVKIDLKNIVSMRKSRYKKNMLRRAVYNLHNKGVIRFYTSGEEFIELVDNDGFTYRIGSQKTQELFKTLKKQINN